jgi:hypothetical protein
LNQENINNLNSSILSYESEVIIKSPPTKESPGPAKFYQTFKEE